MDRSSASHLKEVEALPHAEGPDHPELDSSKTARDSHEEALLKIYQRLRPGNPPQLEKAKRAVQGEVLRREPLPPGPRRPLPHQPEVRPERPRDGDDAPGRGLRQRDQVPPRPAGGRRATSTTSTTSATAACARSTSWPPTSSARASSSSAAPRRSAWRSRTPRTCRPRTLINPKSVSAAIEYFFGRGELSQVVDQTNPLAQLDARAPPVGPRAGRLEPQARRLRGARRAHLALRPHLPDRDAGRHEHRPDLVALASTPRSTSTAS